MNLYDQLNDDYLKLNLERILQERKMSQLQLSELIAEKFNNLPAEHPLLSVLESDPRRLTVSQSQISLMARGYTHMRMIVLLQFLCEVLEVEIDELINANAEREAWVKRMMAVPQEDMPHELLDRWRATPIGVRMKWSLNDVIDQLRLFWIEEVGPGA